MLTAYPWWNIYRRQINRKRCSVAFNLLLVVMMPGIVILAQTYILKCIKNTHYVYVDKLYMCVCVLIYIHI